MKLRLFSTLLLLFSTFAFAQLPTLPAGKPLSVIEKAHAASLMIGQKTISSTAICGGTAIGPHALMTATHCELPTDGLVINGTDHDVTIVGRIRDSYDHSIYLLDGIMFSDYVDVHIAEALEQGEHLFGFGNPAEFVDLYREGYVSGYVQETEEVLLKLDDYSGDSGTGLFNAKGQLVGVISEVIQRTAPHEEIQFAGIFRLQFTEADIARARLFQPPAK